MQIPLESSTKYRDRQRDDTATVFIPPNRSVYGQKAHGKQANTGGIASAQYRKPGKGNERNLSVCLRPPRKHDAGLQSLFLQWKQRIIDFCDCFGQFFTWLDRNYMGNKYFDLLLLFVWAILFVFCFFFAILWCTHPLTGFNRINLQITKMASQHLNFSTNNIFKILNSRPSVKISQ